jgi:hypothetical protein
MATIQNVVDRARASALNDADKARYSDLDLLDFVRDGISEAYSLRPDLRFGKYNVAVELLALGDTFPLEKQHEVAIQHYVVYRAEGRDDEHVNANRETKSFKLFERGILTT